MLRLYAVLFVVSSLAILSAHVLAGDAAAGKPADAKQTVKIVSRLELVDPDKNPAGLYCRVPAFSMRGEPSAVVYYEAVMPGARNKNAEPGVLMFVGRLSANYGPTGTLEIGEQTLEKNVFRIHLRYVTDGSAIAQARKGGDTVATGSTDKDATKSVYFRGRFPNGLAAGDYKVIVELAEYHLEDGKKVFSPKTTIRAFEHLDAEFTIAPDEGGEIKKK